MAPSRRGLSSCLPFFLPVLPANCWPALKFLASGSYDDTIRLYTCEPASDDWVTSHILPPPPPHSHTHVPVSTAPSVGHAATVWGLAFSPDGNFLVSCSADCTLKIWARSAVPPDAALDAAVGGFRVGKSERERWDCIETFARDLFERPVYTVDWLPSDAEGLGHIAAAGADGKIVVWDVVRLGPFISSSSFYVQSAYMLSRGQDSKEPGRVSLSRPTVVDDAHGVSDINCVSFCRLRVPKRPLTVSDEDEDEKLTDTTTGEEDTRWSGARRLLATAGDDGSVKVWKMVG
jgi:WD40 repeat protein